MNDCRHCITYRWSHLAHTRNALLKCKFIFLFNQIKTFHTCHFCRSISGNHSMCKHFFHSLPERIIRMSLTDATLLNRAFIHIGISPSTFNWWTSMRIWGYETLQLFHTVSFLTHTHIGKTQLRIWGCTNSCLDISSQNLHTQAL